MLHLAAVDFVFKLTEGMQTRCGKHGSGFSESQAQRIAIARGVLRLGSIVLLDEATSTLDSEIEEAFMAHLSKN